MRYLQAFERTVDCHPAETALITEAGGKITYGELDERATGLAAALEEDVPGERVATLGANGELAIAAMIAGQKRGKGNVQLPFRNSLEDLGAMLETTDARGLLFDDANAETAAALLERSDLEVAVHAGDAPVDVDALAYEDVVTRSDVEPVEPDPAAEHGCFFTSGTVGESKAVLFDQEQMWLGATQVIMEMGIDETDVGLLCAPWYHMFGTDAWILPHLQAGATLVLQADFDPADALAKIETYDVTGVPAVPTQLNAMLDVLDTASYDVSSLRMIRTGGAVVPVPLIERVQDRLTEGVFNTYGSTEAGPNMTFAHPSVQADHPGTIGKVSYMWDLRVVEPAPPTDDPDPEAEVGPGGTGEIMVQGPGMAEGYLGDPETPSSLIVDGWLRTKDVAEVDEDGYLVVIDRVDNMVITGGENVYPQAVERVLERHPAVADVGVVGLDDERWGQRIAAVVSTDEPLDGATLDEYCRESDRLADYKRPRDYVITDESLPRTETGTLQRALVKERFFDR